MKLIAKTLAGLEKVLSEELSHIGVHNIQSHKRAVSFEGDLEILYKSNLHIRTALRILMPIHSFRCKNEQALYKGIQGIFWWDYMSLRQTFAVDSVVNSPYFNHSQYIALKTKDAIVDQFRKKYQRRPSVNVQSPDIRIHVHINNDQCVVSLDSSGDSLHKRGYRLNQTQAPLNEVLAAGMILLTKWKGNKPFLDPMCGSGTLLAEAAMIASHSPPGITRKRFGFMNWHDFDKNLWGSIFQQARMQRKPISCPIIGLDIDPLAVQKAVKNIQRTHLIDDVHISTGDFFSYPMDEKAGMIVTNPPYDERIFQQDIEGFYQQIGDTLKNNYKGFEAWILSANIGALKSIGLKTSQRIQLFNGPLPCKFHKFDLY